MYPKRKSQNKQKTETLSKQVIKTPIINISKLKEYAKNNMNVVLTGLHGVGKTAIIKSIFNDQFENWEYLSGGTMDPWLDFIGIPKEHEDESGKKYLEIVRPKAFAEDNVEAIYIDEFNRSPKSVRNALLELIQFKSINGKKFNNLKLVWASINPDDEEETYDVEKLDPAQKDRFQIQIELPYRPDYQYFTSKYGEKGHNACEWWFQLTKENRLRVSPRRLEYAISVFDMAGSLRDVIPHSCNITKLKSLLGTKSIEDELENLLKKSNEEIKEELSDYNYYNLVLPKILGSQKAISRICPLLEKENLSQLVSSNIRVRKHVIGQYNFDDYLKEIIDELSRTSNKELRSDIRRGLEQIVISPKKVDFKNMTGKNPLVFKDTILSIGTPYIPDIASQIDTIARREKLNEMYNRMTTNLSSEQSLRIIKQLNDYCGYSQNKTVLKNKSMIIPILNHAKKFSNKTFQEIFIQHSKLWTKIWNCKLVENLYAE